MFIGSGVEGFRVLEFRVYLGLRLPAVWGGVGGMPDIIRGVISCLLCRSVSPR